MKKHRWSVVMLGVAAVLALGGCGGGDGAGDASQWATGEWTLESVSHSIHGPRQPALDYGMSAMLAIAPDGTWSGSGFHPESGDVTVLTGTWTYVGVYTWLIERPEVSVPLFRHRDQLYFAVIDLREDRELIGWFRRTG